MNQNEIAGDDRTSENETDRTVSLPTRNPSPGDPGTNPQRDNHIIPGQPEVGGTGSSNSNTGGSAIMDAEDSHLADGAQSA